MDKRSIAGLGYGWRIKNEWPQKLETLKLEASLGEWELRDLVTELITFSETHEDSHVSIEHEMGRYDEVSVWLAVVGWRTVLMDELAELRAAEKARQKELKVQREQSLQASIDRAERELEELRKRKR